MGWSSFDKSVATSPKISHHHNTDYHGRWTTKFLISLSLSKLRMLPHLSLFLSSLLLSPSKYHRRSCSPFPAATTSTYDNQCHLLLLFPVIKTLIQPSIIHLTGHLQPMITPAIHYNCEETIKKIPICLRNFEFEEDYPCFDFNL